MGSRTVRTDVFVYSVRLFKSRALAAAACRAGHVSVNGTKVKPASPIRVGDRVDALTPGGLKRYEVLRTIDKRPSAAVAALAYVDHSPPPIPKAERPAPIAVRAAGSGRPTKRDRRKIDRLRGR